MEQQTQLKIATWMYTIGKCFTLGFELYTFVYIIWNPEEDYSYSIHLILSGIIIIALFISACMLLDTFKLLFNEDVHRREYINLIFYEVLVSSFCITLHMIAIILSNLRYIYESELKMNENRHLENEPFDDEFEASSMQNLASLTNITETSNLIYTTLNSKLKSSIHEPSGPFYQDLYYIFVVSSLSKVSTVGIILQSFVVITLGLIEYIKCKIRKTRQPVEVLEMGAINNAEHN